MSSKTWRTWRYFTLTMLAALIMMCSETMSQQLPRALMLTGNGNVPSYKENYPPWIHQFQNDMVMEILQGIADVDTTTDLNVLSESNLKNYDVVISNSIFLAPTEEQLNSLYAFVANGKSYLTLHCGILSLLNWDRYEEFIGGIFIGGPSSVPAGFHVTTENVEFWGYEYTFRNNKQHPVAIVTDDFATQDELYHFQPSKREFYVIARAENLPVMWWHPVGKGRVMSLTLGHDEKAKSVAGYQELLRNGVKWLTGTPLIYGEQPRVVSNRTLLLKNFINLQTFTTGDSLALKYSVDKHDDPGLFSVQSSNSGNLDLRLSGKAGSSSFVAAVRNAKGLVSKKMFNVRVVPDGTGNIAAYYGNTAVSSSNENQSSVFQADNIIDEDSSTRWSSAPCDSAWVTVDLKKKYPLKKIVLRWEASHATAYTIEGSDDGRTWIQLAAEINGDGDVDTLQLTGSPIRFIKLNMKKRYGNKWGYSLYEVEAYQ